MITVAAPGTDVVAEGEAQDRPGRVPSCGRSPSCSEDWGPQVRDGAFWHEFSAPSAGPPPWDVYEITPRTVYGLSSGEPHGATRWRL